MAATTSDSEKDVLKGPYIEQVALNSQAASQLLRAINVTNLDREFWDRYWRISGVYKVKNERLQKAFGEVKEELKSANAKPEQHREVLVFSNETKRGVEEISREGSRAGARKSHVLGHAGSGVHLVRHYDILTRYLAIKQGSAPCYIVIHRAVLGKTKPIVPRPHKDENFVKPYIGFDCHVSARRVQSRMPIHDAYKSSHIYFYEHETDASFTTEYPRQILPHAVIELDKKHPIHFETPFLAVGTNVSLWEVKGETRRGFRFVLAKQTAKQDERPLTRKRKIDQLKTQLQDQLLEMRTRWPDSCSESKAPRLSSSSSVDDKTESEVLSESEQSDVVEKKPISGVNRQDKHIISGKFESRTEAKRTPEYSNESKLSILARNSTDIPLSFKPYVSLRRLSANTLGISSGESTPEYYEPEKTTLVNKDEPSEPCIADVIEKETVESRRSSGNATSEEQPDIGISLVVVDKSVVDMLPKTREGVDISNKSIGTCLNKEKSSEDSGDSSKDYVQYNTRRANSTEGKTDSRKMNIDEADKNRHALVGEDTVVSMYKRNSQSAFAVSARDGKKTSVCLDKDVGIQDEQHGPPVLTAVYEREIHGSAFGCGHAAVLTVDKDNTRHVHHTSNSTGEKITVRLNPDRQESHIAGNCPKPFLDTREVMANFKAVSKQNLNQLCMHSIHVPNLEQQSLENQSIPNATNKQRPKRDADKNISTNKSPVVKDTSTLKIAEASDKSRGNLGTDLSHEVEIRKKESEGPPNEGQGVHDKALNCKTTDNNKDTEEINSLDVSCKELPKLESSRRAFDLNQPSQVDNTHRANWEQNIAPTFVKPEAKVLESKPLPKARTENVETCNQENKRGQHCWTNTSSATKETSTLSRNVTNDENREKLEKGLSQEVEIRKNGSDSSTNEGSERHDAFKNNTTTNIFNVTKETNSSDVTCSKSLKSECSTDMSDSKQPRQADNIPVDREQSIVSSSVKQDVKASDPKPLSKTRTEGTATCNQKDKIGVRNREKNLTVPEQNATQECQKQIHRSQTEHITDDDIVVMASPRKDTLPSDDVHDYTHLRRHLDSSGGEYDSNLSMHRPDTETSFFKHFLQPIHGRAPTNVTIHNPFLNRTTNANNIRPDISLEGQIKTPEKSVITTCTDNVVKTPDTKQIQQHTPKIPEKIPTIIGVPRSSKTVRATSMVRLSDNSISAPVDNQNTSFFKPFLHTGGNKTGFQKAQSGHKTSNGKLTTASADYSNNLGQTLISTYGNNKIQEKSYTMTGLSKSMSPPAGDIAPKGMNSFPLDLSAKATGGPIAISMSTTNEMTNSNVASQQSPINRQTADTTRVLLSSKNDMHVSGNVATKQIDIKDTQNVRSLTTTSTFKTPKSEINVSRSTLMKQNDIQDAQPGQLIRSHAPLSVVRTHEKCNEDSRNQLHTQSTNKQNVPKESTQTLETGKAKSTSDASGDTGKRFIPPGPIAGSTTHAKDKCSPKEDGENIEENPLNILKTRMSVDENTAKRIQQFLFEKISLQTKRQSENGARAENSPKKEENQQNVSTDLCTKTESDGQKSNMLPKPSDTLAHASRRTVKCTPSKSETIKQANHSDVNPITSETGAATAVKQVSNLNIKPRPSKLETDTQTKTTLTANQGPSKTDSVAQNSYSTVKRSLSKTEPMPQTSNSPVKPNASNAETVKHTNYSNLKPNVLNTENEKPANLSSKENTTQNSFKPIQSKSDNSKQIRSLTVNRSPSKTETVTHARPSTIQPNTSISVPIVHRSPSKSESAAQSSKSVVNRTQSKLETVIQTSQSTVNSNPSKPIPSIYAGHSTVHSRSLGTDIIKQTSVKQTGIANVQRSPSKPESVTRTSPSTINRIQSKPKPETVAQTNHSTVNLSPSKSLTVTNTNRLTVNPSPVTPVTTTQRNYLTVKDNQSKPETMLQASHSTVQTHFLGTDSVKQTSNMNAHRSHLKAERVAQSSHSILNKRTSTIETKLKADHLQLQPNPSNIETMTQTSQMNVKQGALRTDSSTNIDQSNDKRDLPSTQSSSKTSRLIVNQSPSKPETMTQHVKPNSSNTETAKQTSNLVFKQGHIKTETLPQFAHSAVLRSSSNTKPVSQTSNLTLQPSPSSTEIAKQANHPTVTPSQMRSALKTNAENNTEKPSSQTAFGKRDHLNSETNAKRIEPSNRNTCKVAHEGHKNKEFEREKPSSVECGISVDDSAEPKNTSHSTVEQQTTMTIQPLRIKREIIDDSYEEHSSQITGASSNNDDKIPRHKDKETMNGSQSESHHRTQSETQKQAEDMTKGECKRAILQTLNELSDVLKRINESKKARELTASKTSTENKDQMEINRKMEEEIKLNSIIKATDKTTITVNKATINAISNDRNPLHEDQNSDVSRVRTSEKDAQGPTKGSLVPTNPPEPYANSDMSRSNNMTTKASQNTADENMIVHPITTVKVERSEDDHTCHTESLPFHRDTMEIANYSSGDEHPHTHQNEGRRVQSPQSHESNPVDPTFPEGRVCVSEQPTITGSENRDFLSNQRKLYRQTALREISRTSDANTYKHKSGNIPAVSQRVESTERTQSNNTGLEANMIVRDATTASRDNTGYNEYREGLLNDEMDQKPSVTSIEERWARINYSSSYLGPLDRRSGAELVPVSTQDSTGIIERMREVCDGEDISTTRQKQFDTDGEVIFSFQEVRRMKSIQYRKYKMGVSQNKFIDYADVRHEHEKKKGNRRNARNEFESHKEDSRSDIPSTRTRSYPSNMNRTMFAARERKWQRSRVRKPDSSDFEREDISPPKREKHTREHHYERSKPSKLSYSKHTFKKNGTGYFKWRSKYNPRQPGKDAEGEYIITKRGKRQSLAEFNRWTKFREREGIRKNIEIALKEYKKTFEKEDKTNADRKVASYLQSLSGPLGRRKEEQTKQTTRSSSLKRKDHQVPPATQPGSGDRERESESHITSGGRDSTVRNDQDKKVSVNTVLGSNSLINPVQPDLGNLLSANVIEGLIRQHVASNFAHLTEKLKEDMSRQLLGNASNHSSHQPVAVPKASSDSQCHESTHNTRDPRSRSNSRERNMRKYDTYRNRGVSQETVDHGAYAVTLRRDSYDNQGDTRAESNRRRSSSRERERNFETSYASDRRNSYRQRSRSRDREIEYTSSYRDNRRNSYGQRSESRDRERDYVSSYRDDRRNSYKHRSPNREFEREYISASPSRDVNSDSCQYKTEPRDGDREYVSSYRDDTRQPYRHGSKSGDEESQNVASYKDEKRYAYQHRSKSREAEPAYEYSHRRHSRSPTRFEKDDYDYRLGGGSSRQNWDRDYESDENYSNSQKRTHYEEYNERSSSKTGRYENKGSYKRRNERSPRRSLSREDRYESSYVERRRSGSRGDDFDIRDRDSFRYRGYETETAYRKSPDAFTGETGRSPIRARTRSRSNGRDSSKEKRGSTPSLENVSSLEDGMLHKTRSDSESNHRRKWHFYPTQSEYVNRSYSDTSTYKRPFRHHNSESDYKSQDESANRHDYFDHRTKDKRPRLDHSPDSEFKLCKSPVGRSDHHVRVSSIERSKSPPEHKPSMNELCTAVSHKSSQSESSETSTRGRRAKDSQQYDYNTRNRSPPDRYISKDRVDDSDPISEEFDAYQFCRNTYPGIPPPDPKKHRYYPPKASATVTHASPEHRPESSS